MRTHSFLIGLSTAGIATILISGCANIHSMKNKFDPQEISWVKEKGTNIIKGEAFLKTVGGDIKTCAGNTAVLTPVSDYSRERILSLYGSDQKGIKQKFDGRSDNFNITDNRYKEYTIKSVCNSKGEYSFEKIPDGDYFLTAQIFWKSNPRSLFFEGGNIMQRVKVTGHETKEVILTY